LDIGEREKKEHRTQNTGNRKKEKSRKIKIKHSS
jgi:hypothetical protein